MATIRDTDRDQGETLRDAKLADTTLFRSRSWPTKYRGALAIHAAAKNPADVYKILDFDTNQLI